MNPVSASHPGAGRLAAFVSGLLDPDQSAAIESHLADCDTCRTVLEALPEDTLSSLLREGAARFKPPPVPERDLNFPADEAAKGNPSSMPPTEPAASPPAAGFPVPAGLEDHPRYRVVARLG